MFRSVRHLLHGWKGQIVANHGHKVYTVEWEDAPDEKKRTVEFAKHLGKRGDTEKMKGGKRDG
jgi:hypothetical protein